MAFLWWLTVTIAVVWSLSLATALTRTYIKNHTYFELDDETMNRVTKNL